MPISMIRCLPDQWTAQISKPMLWRNKNWTKYEPNSTNLALRIYYDQLLIISESKVLESFNMYSKMKGIYKEDILILINSVSGQDLKKLKFQIRTDVTECLQKLASHFPIIHHKSLQSYCVQSKYRNLEEVLKCALQGGATTSCVPLPPAYENFIRLCLLDPTFPQAVQETERILQEKILGK